MSRQDRKVAVLLAGMHRSGTSLVTRLLSLVGCDLPTTLMPPVPDNNETGFWESQPVADLNDEILASAGSRWNDWRTFNPDWYGSPVAGQFRERAQAILHEQVGDSRLFVLKDPRICRLMPFWVEAVSAIGAEPVVVSPVRNPFDVAASLQARDGIDSSAGCLMWLRHVLDAERASRDLERVYLRYETLLSEVHAIVDMVGDTLGIAWPRAFSVSAQIELEEFVSPDLHHHRTDDAKILGNPRLSSWIVSSFEILDRWCRGETRENDISKLGQIKGAFDAATPAFSRILAVSERVISERDGQIEGLSQTVAERDGRIEGLSRTVAERDGRIEALSRTVTERDGQIEGLSRTVAERDGRIEALSRTVTERDGQIEGLSRTVAERDGQIEGLGQAVAERDGRIEGLSQTVAERDGRIEGLSRTVAERDGRIEGLGQAVAERDGRIEGLGQAVAERDGRIEGLSRTVAERDGQIEGLGQAVAERDGRIEGLSQTVAERDGRIEGLSRTVAERDGRIEGLGQAVAERDGRIEALSRTVTERDGQIEGLSRTVAERDGRIEGLGQAVAERDGRIEGLGQAVAERDGRIEALSRTVTERDGQIEGLSRTVAERDGRIEGLGQAVAERDGQIEGLSRTVAERDGRIEGLGQAVAERDGQIEGLDQTVAERDGQIEGLNQAVAERDGQIEGLGQAVAERDGQIEGLSRTVAERDHWIEGLSRGVLERDNRIEGLGQTVAERDGQIEGLGQAVAERDGQIEGLDQTVAERDGQVEGLSQAVAERDGQIEGLNQAVAERDGQIEELSQTVAERDEQIEGLSQAVAERDEQIEGLSQAVAERGHRVRTLHETVAERDYLIAELYNSNSWRLSAPLRSLRRALQAPIRTIRGVTSRTSRVLYRRAPLPLAAKIRIKGSLFRSAPWLFRHTLAWRMWANVTYPTGVGKHLPGAEPAQPDLRSRKYRAASRAELADLFVAATKDDGRIPILFDPEFYLDRNEDVRNDGVDPLEHYRKWGATEGRMPVADVQPDELHPLVRDLHRLDLTDIKATTFDCDIYRRLNPDLAPLGDEALAAHYERHGRAESRICSLQTFVSQSCGNPIEIPLDFDPDEYVDLYSQDLWIFEGRPLEALHHYMHRGRWEHRYYSLRSLHEASSPTCGLSKAAVTVPPEFVKDMPSLCVLAHVYHPELWNELSIYIGNLPEETYDLYVNLVDTTFSPELVSDIRERFPSARVQISKNHGRDIGGHVRLLKNIRIEDYRIYCLIHTKMSSQLSKAQAILWRRGLLNPLMGTKERAAENIALMLKDETIGQLASGEHRYTRIDNNREKYEVLLDRLGISHGSRNVECVTGTMMFLRADVLRRIFDGIRDLPFVDGSSGKSSDPLPDDGQWEHAVERIVGSVVRNMGYRTEWR